MKIKAFLSKSSSSQETARARRLWLCLGLGVAALAVIGAAARGPHKLVVHEWGTFTSVQGADGVLMNWRPLDTAELPKFVYNWSHPGYNRAATGPMFVSKAGMTTLQRMETPVIYFYSDEEITADVSVKFPQGMITEWYPQARQIGPAIEQTPKLVQTLDNAAHKVGAKPEFTFASFLPHHAVKDSRIAWSDIHVLPASPNAEVAGLVPFDKSGSHYFAARETDAAFVRLDAYSRTNPVPEHEKFLFYRGVGNFSTPLKVITSPDGKISVENSGKEAMAALFLLNVRDGKGSFASLGKLESGSKKEFAQSNRVRDGKGNSATLEEFQNQISAAVQSALVSEGLFPREAAAMVKTWRESWFAEAGVRVLYVLPRKWTDGTLPLDIDPKPTELVRVMVGRAEIITPELENRLREQLTKAKAGDTEARVQALAELKRLGRFASPAIQRVVGNGANSKFDPQLSQFAWTLMQTAAAKTTTVSAL